MLRDWSRGGRRVPRNGHRRHRRPGLFGCPVGHPFHGYHGQHNATAALHLLRGFPFVRSASARQYRRLCLWGWWKTVGADRCPDTGHAGADLSDPASGGFKNFSREWIMAWCEAQGVDYVFGLAKTSRLQGGEGRAGRSEGASSAAREGGAVIAGRLSLTGRLPWSRVRRWSPRPSTWPNGPTALHRDFKLDEEAIGREVPLYERIYCARGTRLENRPQGAAARPVRGPGRSLHADALQSVAALPVRRWPMN